MGKFVERRFLIYFAVIALFLLLVPLAVCRGQEILNSSSACSSYVFSQGVTVESLQAQLDEQGRGQKLTVWKQDGTQRYSGAIETGDILEVTDAKGNLQSRVSAVIGVNSSSSVSPDSSSSQHPDSSEVTGTVREGYYVYAQPVTVEKIKTQISENLSFESKSLEIVAPSGRKRDSGSICTGDTLKIVDSQGKTESSVIAVIPGDLTRCGRGTRKSCEMVYSYLTGKEGLEGDLFVAADMDGNGIVNTADLLQIKKGLS